MKARTQPGSEEEPAQKWHETVNLPHGPGITAPTPGTSCVLPGRVRVQVGWLVPSVHPAQWALPGLPSLPPLFVLLGKEVLAAHPELLSSYPVQCPLPTLPFFPTADRGCLSWTGVWSLKLHPTLVLALPGVLRIPFISHPVQGVRPTGHPDE